MPLGEMIIEDPFASYSGGGYVSTRGGGGYVSSFADRGYPDFSVDILRGTGYTPFNQDQLFDVRDYSDRTAVTGDPIEHETVSTFGGNQDRLYDPIQSGALETAAPDESGTAAGEQFDLLSDPLFWVAVIVVGVLVVK